MKQLIMMIKYLILSLLLIVNVRADTWYVTPTGAGTGAGTSWANAGDAGDVSFVNSNTAGGDTVWFGTGVYRGTIVPISGTSEDRTMYACSAMYEGCAEIWGSDSMGTWTQEAGNVYYTDDFGGTNYYPFGGETQLWIVGQLDGTYDTVLTRQTNTSLSEGEFYLNGSDRLYVYRFGGGNPETSQIEPSQGAPIYYRDGQDYTTFWGFKLRYGNFAGVYIDNAWGGGGIDLNHWEHLNIDWVGFGPGRNSGGIQANRGGGGNDSASASHYNVIRACSTFHVMELGTGNNSHEAGIGLYTMWNTVVESCFVSISNWGIIDKEQGHYNTFRYNTCYMNGQVEGAGIRINNSCSNDSVYGNIIIGNGTEPVYGIWITGMIDGFSNTYDSMFVGNNTIFRTGGTGLATINYSSGSWTAPNWFKYNVVDSVTAPGGGEYGYVALDNNNDVASWVEIDSNLYNGATVVFAAGRTNRTWSVWRSTFSYDANSTNNVAPGWDSVNAADPWLGFMRSGTSPEMDVTYGGRTWTVFGAVQPAEEQEEPEEAAGCQVSGNAQISGNFKMSGE